MTMPTPRQHRGFTLAELLAVTAMLFALMLLIVVALPFIPLDRRPYQWQSNCMSNIKAMIQGARMYRDDHGACPEALYGTSPDGVSFSPRLYPSYVKEASTFTCPQSPVTRRTSPELVLAINQTTGSVAWVAACSSYDAQLRNPDSPRAIFEQHYAVGWRPRRWDRDPRQLAARDPADSTVVTWCLYHAEPDRRTGAVKAEKMAIVGFWDGRVQKLPAEHLSDWPNVEGRFPWQVLPKP